VAALVKDHVLSLKTVIDAQKARDQAGVYNGLREAIGHMGHIADPLAGAIARQFPEKYPGDPMSPGVDYRVALNNLLAEHVYLAASAAVGGLGGNQSQFQAAAASLDGNSIDIAKGVGAAYGPEAEMAFLPLWRSHINMVADYVVGRATDDQGKQDKAVADLIGYTQDLGTFLSGANENLPKDVVADLVKSHADTLKDVIDTQAAGNPTAHYAAVRAAGGHMGHIANPLAEATVAKFPRKFAGMVSTMPAPMGSTMMPSMGPSMAGVEANIRQFSFQPNPLEMSLGTTVTWTNQDGVQHSVTGSNSEFDSGLFTQGQAFSFTFDGPGTISYFCSRHPSMQGTVTVS
jgi:plastocyanin